MSAHSNNRDHDSTIPTTMRAAVWVGPEQMETSTVPVPQVPPGWCLVRTAYTGICGTDLAIWRGLHPRATAPLVPGHEISGWVAVAGAGGPAVGTLVVAEPLISCGGCGPCGSGASHVCTSLGLYGIDAPGGMAEYVALPTRVLHAVPAEVGPRAAALAEPLAVAVHAIARSDLRAGQVVAVYGAGPVGLLTALVARHNGAGAVVVSDPNPWRRQVAAGLGLTVVPEGSSMTEVLEPLTAGQGADRTIDAAAHPAVAAQLAGVTRVHGRITIVGVYEHPATPDLRAVCFKEQSISGVRVYTTADVRRAVELISAQTIDLAAFPTTAFDLARASDAFQAAAGGQGCLKVLLTPVEGLAGA